MKVLWFCNTPANGAGYFKQKTFGGGWMKRLNQVVEKEMDLHIAFFNPGGPETFSYGNSTYYSIMPKDWKQKLIFQSFLNRVPKSIDKGLLKQIVKKVKPDLIHIHGSESSFIEIIGHIDIPTVVSMQGILTVYYHIFNRGIEERYLNKVYQETPFQVHSFLPKSLSFVKKKFKAWSAREERQMKKLKYVLGRTDWDRRVSRVLAPESIYFKVDRILKEPFYQTQWQQPKNDTLTIHTTSSGGPYKGLETICHTLHLLNQVGKKVRWRVAGINHDSPLVKAVKLKLRDRYPQHGLELMGKVDASTLIDSMMKADLYAMASHIENSPNNLAEAMILGMPCIASHAGGTNSYLKDGQEGILLQSGDPWSLAGSILELSNNPDLAACYGSAAREVALVRHDPDRVLHQLKHAYQEIRTHAKVYNP